MLQATELLKSLVRITRYTSPLCRQAEILHREAEGVRYRQVGVIHGRLEIRRRAEEHLGAGARCNRAAHMRRQE